MLVKPVGFPHKAFYTDAIGGFGYEFLGDCASKVSGLIGDWHLCMPQNERVFPQDMALRKQVLNPFFPFESLRFRKWELQD